MNEGGTRSLPVTAATGIGERNIWFWCCDFTRLHNTLDVGLRSQKPDCVWFVGNPEVGKSDPGFRPVPTTGRPVGSGAGASSLDSCVGRRSTARRVERGVAKPEPHGELQSQPWCSRREPSRTLEESECYSRGRAAEQLLGLTLGKRLPVRQMKHGDRRSVDLGAQPHAQRLGPGLKFRAPFVVALFERYGPSRKGDRDFVLVWVLENLSNGQRYSNISVLPLD
jgi:hypothetical protein